MNKTIDRLEKDLEQIKNEISQLVTYNYVYDQTLSIVTKNKELPKANPFYGFISYSYAYSAAVTIRKLADNVKDPKKTISFWDFLQELCTGHRLFSRAWYLSYKETATHPIVIENRHHHLNRLFDKFAPNGSLFIDVMLIKRDLAEIKRISQKLIIFVDQAIAHIDRNKPVAPLYIEIDESISCLQKLCLKYLELFKIGSYKSLLHPVLEFDEWKNVFYIPWVK